MGTQTTEEVKEEMCKKMGSDFGSLFYSLYNEITWLTFKWIEFRELFGTKESRFELMNKVAPFFFFTVQNILWENLLLGVARITDPPETFKKKNTTLQTIGQHLADSGFKVEFEKDLNDILMECQFCRDWRNRWIAHMDYELGVNRENAKPLEQASRLKLRLTIEKIHSLYNKISLKYLDSTTAWQMLSSDRGAISLLYRMEDGLRFDEEVHKKKLSGGWEPDNFQSKV
jgi:hypothetical protein